MQITDDKLHIQYILTSWITTCDKWNYEYRWYLYNVYKASIGIHEFTTMKICIVKTRQSPESTWSSPTIAEYHVLLFERSTFEYLYLQHEHSASPIRDVYTKQCIEYVRHNTTICKIRAQVKPNTETTFVYTCGIVYVTFFSLLFYAL